MMKREPIALRTWRYSRKRLGQGMAEYAIVVFLLSALGGMMVLICHEVIKYYNMFALLVSIPLP